MIRQSVLDQTIAENKVFTLETATILACRLIDTFPGKIYVQKIEEAGVVGYASSGTYLRYVIWVAFWDIGRSDERRALSCPQEYVDLLCELDTAEA